MTTKTHTVCSLIDTMDKCNRCWKYNIELDSDDPLCQRCVEALKHIGFDAVEFDNRAWHKIFVEGVGFLHLWIKIKTRKQLRIDFHPFSPEPFLSGVKCMFPDEVFKCHEHGNIICTGDVTKFPEQDDEKGRMEHFNLLGDPLIYKNRPNKKEQ